MEGISFEEGQQECEQDFTGKFRGSHERAVREDRNSEDPPIQIQG
jgi:hypothetical protein